MPAHEPPTPLRTDAAERGAPSTPSSDRRPPRIAQPTGWRPQQASDGGLLAVALQRAVQQRAAPSQPIIARARTKGRERSPSPERRPHVSFKERVKRTARRIAEGHGYKHRGEFGSIRSRDDYARRVVDVMMYARHVRGLSGGRTAYYDEHTNTLVLHNPNDRDEGTMYKPTGGWSYVRRLR